MHYVVDLAGELGMKVAGEEIHGFSSVWLLNQQVELFVTTFLEKNFI